MSRPAVAVPLLGSLLAIAIAIAFGACGNEDKPEPATVTASATEDVPRAAAPTASARRNSPSSKLSLDHPADGYPTIWVRGGREVEIRTEPDGGELVERVGRRTEFDSPSVFGVIEKRGNWAGVTYPKLANNQLGWIELDPKRLKSGWTRVSISVDISERRAELREGPRVVRSFAVTVGAPESETPTGRFAVTDTFRGDLDAAYGCCALALSANQPNLPSGWFGGNRIAIHGTAGALGVAESSGCVRAADADVSKLVDRAPLGAPVFIRA